MSMIGERCQYCGHDEFRMSDDSERLGVEIRVCNSCNMFFDSMSQERAKEQDVNSCFEESHDSDDGFGEEVDWL